MADPKPDRKKAYEDYLLNYAVNKGEGQQFDDDVKQGPPYTSRGFAIGQNEDRVERAAPKFANGGMVKHGSSTRVTCNKKG